MRQDPNNFHQNWLNACDPLAPPPFAVGMKPAPCRMDGFDQNQTNQFDPGLVYSYVDYAETKPYWDIAKAYTIGDAFFMSRCDSPSGTTTLMLNASGQEKPSSASPCFGYRSLADLVDAAHLSWRLYSYSICQNINALDVNQTIR
ncbi:MAG TPA: alkaline phosphatase family protein [Candidatus Baltobacteraceae bacterium]|nr:alkaline phosphatase family protein [Candidatus Baltobacteraceae bacterium]